MPQETGHQADGQPADIKHILVKLPVDQWRRLRVIAAAQDTNLTQMARDMFERIINEYNTKEGNE